MLKIARIEGEGYFFFDSPMAVSEELSKLKTAPDLFTFMPRLTEANQRHPFYCEMDNLAVLPISTFEHWLTKQIDFKARNRARKAEKKGVILREVPFDDELVRGISAIYNETPIRQGRRFHHFGRDFESLKRIKSTFLDRSLFLGAYLNDELIGFAKLVCSEDRSQAGLMHILSMQKHRDKAPTNALLSQAVKSCAARSIPHLWYANFQYGQKQLDGLAKFKAVNGFLRMDLPRYYIPLTPLGRAALTMGLHRRVQDYIPNSMTSIYRGLRNHWNAMVYSTAEQE